MDTDIPIDIHYNKLLDWLISRRHCKQQWQGAALEVREKINTAIQDMPPVEQITQLLHGTYINYFHCQRITELLKSTDDGSKNIFGRYSSQRMKDWLDILKCYDTECTYLAEAAQMLARNVNYEIPALKRQITKCQHTQNDCTRKEGEYASNSSEMKQKYFSSCRQMGIKGNKVKTELLSLVEDMPTTYNELAQSLHALRSACNYYTAFMTFMLGSEEKGSACLSVLKHIIERGNTTTYEWKHGTSPSRVEEPLRDYGMSDEENTTNDADGETGEIDWGALDAETDTIDFNIAEEDTGIAVEEGVSAADGIDWGNDGTATTIELVDDSTVDLAVSTDDHVARGTDALTLLDNTETRNLLVNQLLELEAFLTLRVQELSDDSSVLSASQFHAAPQEVQVTAATVQGMLGAVGEIVVQMTSKKMQDLFLIRSSPRYVHRMADSLKKILSDSEKLMSLSRLMVLRRQESLQEEKDTQPKVDLLRTRTQELRKQIENEISKKYKGRRVNIMGEINTI